MFFNLISLIIGIFFPLNMSTNSFPKPLSAKEEEHYLNAYKEGDQSARNKLIEHNLRLVAHIIKKYYSATGDQDDLISIGTIGLIKGINTYKHTKGTRLATYAARCIENEILMYFRSQKKLANDVYLQDPIDTDKEGNPLALMDVISADNTALERVDMMDLEQKLHGFIQSKLSKREAQIIILRYGLYGHIPQTQREIAARCKISRSYVSRIEKKAVKKLADCFAGQDIFKF